MNGTLDGASRTDEGTFGGRVSAARHAQGLSQTELAARLGLTPKTVASWEIGASRPRSNKMQMLAAILNVSLRWLMSGSGDDGVANSASEPGHADVASLHSILAEMRVLKTDLTNSADRLNRLEKRLQDAL